MVRPAPANEALSVLRDEIVACTACPRLVAWRNEAAEHPPAAHAGERYWARPLPGFGDPRATLVLVGLAPAAHGGNRTGRMFTGDRSGSFLFAALHRAGLANQPTSRAAHDGLELTGAYVTAAVRCAPPENRPSPAERRTCAPFLTRELLALGSARVLVALGAIAYEALRRDPAVSILDSPAPRFSHGMQAEVSLSGRAVQLICSFHPSQRNVFTGRLTEDMLDAVLARALVLASRPS